MKSEVFAFGGFNDSKSENILDWLQVDNIDSVKMQEKLIEVN